MKRVTAFFLFCLLLLTGCQPTPAVETVPPKDFDALIEKAQTSPATVQVTLVPEAEEISAAAAEEALERFQMEFYGNSEAFHVVVDAQVVRPEGPFPILEVTPGDFDDESAQPFFDVLTEGYTLYTAEELETKASLEKQIIEMQQFIDDGLPGYDGPASKKKDEIKHWQKELDALKQQGKRNDLTSRQDVGKLESAEQVSESESGRQIQRYIRLTHLLPGFLKLVDEGRIALTPAVYLSYLPEEEQRWVLDEMEREVIELN